MIDQWNCRRAERLGEVFDKSYGPDQAVSGVYLRNAAAPKLTVLFPPWHGGGRALDILKNRLAKAGSAVLAFDFHDQILEPSVEGVVASFDRMQATTAEAVTKLQATNGYEHTRLLSLSLGTVSLARAASVLAFDSASIVVGSSNLARSLWEGDRTQMIRRGLEPQGVTGEMLDEAWVDLAPKNYAGSFAGKDVSMTISETDNVVPTQYQLELAQHLFLAGANVNASFTNLGHYATAASFCILGK